MPFFSLARRIAGRFTLERRELQRLVQLPRGAAATTHLIAPSFDTLDGGSLAAQYRQIFQQNAFLFPAPTPRPRIIDCGANVGCFTTYFAQRFPEAIITAFEPDPLVFSVLQRNVARGCGTARVELVKAAVTGTAETTVSFYADHCDAGSTTMNLAGGATMQVAAVRLREYLKLPCDLLKIDIEGAEVEVLNDSEECLSQVSRIFVEFHSFASRPQRLDQVIAVLARAGFRLFVQAGKSPPKPFLSAEAFLGMDSQLDIWGVRS
jgi:FkbM family methyltransferase